jgi:GH25 family lysozyme M1 (1,4-beta-N-acetylmuramidase)
MRPQGNLIVDVSGYQPPGRVPWTDARITGAYVKLTEGTTKSSGASYHVPAITLAGKYFGAYHFFRPDDLPDEQFAIFQEAAQAVNYGQSDWIPALDIERCVTRGKWTEVDKSWNSPLQALVELLVKNYDDVLLYIGWASFIQLGSPAWVLEHKLWVPYVSVDGQPPPASCRKTPGGKIEFMWQFMWGPLFGDVQASTSPVGVDQSVCVVLPPAIGSRPSAV